jgi:uncharacterized membrane protein
MKVQESQIRTTGEYHPQHAVRSSSRLPMLSFGGLGVHCAFLVLIGIFMVFRGIWVFQVLLVILLLSVPGVILLRTLRIPGRTVAHFPALVPCASIVVLLSSGLAVDLSGPLIGLRNPLRITSVLVCLELCCIILLALGINAGPDVKIPWRSIPKPGHLAWPLALPLIAAAGAMRLDNNHSNSVAVVALFFCVGVLIASMLFASRIDEPLMAVILYSVGLAMMWSYSLRGSLVYGFDIATEYQRLNQTVVAGVWHFNHHNDAYGAMLSLTVMPTELHVLSGLPASLVLKIVYPVIGALFPLEIFGLARRVLAKPWAFLAAAFTIAQTAFAQELPALARQEIALVLFVALVTVMLDSQLERRSQWGLVVLLSLAMVVSHYSTTYVAIALIGLTLPLQWITSWFRNSARVTGAIALSFVVLLVGAFIWYGPLTKSSSGLKQVAQTVAAQGLDLLPSQNSGESPLAAYFQSAQPTMSATSYEKLVHTRYALNDPSISPLPDASLPKYALHNSMPSVPHVKLAIVHGAISLGSLISQELLNLLGVIGALIMVLRKNASTETRHIGLLGLAAVVFLTVIKLSGTLAGFYSNQRALLQALGILSITFCWPIQSLANQRERAQVVMRFACAAFLTVFIINTSGLSNAVLGGETRTNLANSGEDFQRFVMTKPELASADWLGNQVHPGQLVYADYYAQLPLIAMTGIGQGLIIDVTPLTINQSAWIYTDRANIVDRRGQAFFDNDRVTYIYPMDFLNSNFNIVYTNGSSEVFHR